MKTKSISLSLFVSFIENEGYSYCEKTTYMGSTQTIYENSYGFQYKISSVGDHIINICYKQKNCNFGENIKIDFRKNFWKQFVK